MKVVEGKLKLKLKKNKGQRIPVRFIIKEDVGKVIAVTNMSMKLVFEDMIDKKYPILFTGGFPMNAYLSRIQMNDTYKAVASLDSEDTWNERKGVQIAAKKLKDKLNDAMTRRLAYVKDYLHKTADNM